MQDFYLDYLPVHVSAVEREPEEEDATLAKLESYLRSKPLMAKAARDIKLVEQIVLIAANCSGLYCTRWDNPDTGFWLMVVMDKKSLPSKEKFLYVITRPKIIKSFKTWTR